MHFAALAVAALSLVPLALAASNAVYLWREHHDRPDPCHGQHPCQLPQRKPPTGTTRGTGSFGPR